MNPFAVTNRKLYGFIAVAIWAQAVVAQSPGFLGVRAKKGDTFEQCAVIGQLAPGGPAERAGLVPGDVISSINGIAVDCAGIQKGTPMIPALKAGDRIVFSVLRAGKELAVTIVADAYPVEMAGVQDAQENQARREAGHWVFQKLVRTQEVFTFTKLKNGGFELSGGKLNDQELRDLHYYFDKGHEGRLLPQEMKTDSQDMYVHFDRAKGHVQFEFVNPPGAAPAKP